MAERLLGMAIFVDQPLIGLGLLDRVEILALDILEQGDFERLGVVEVADDHRDFVQPRLLRRAPAPLAGDDLVAVAVRADDDRLDQPARRDRGGELVERGLVEMAARLVGMRLDATTTGIIWTPPRAGRRRRPALPARTSPSKADRPRPRPEGGGGERLVAHAATARLGRRAISSRASAI